MKTTGLLLALASAPLGPLYGQWSSDPSASLEIAGDPHAQVQPKIVGTSDGGSFVSWFDNDPAGSPAGGFDVRLQRLDAEGRALWPIGGVLIADRGFSSTQDYGLGVDEADFALLAFRDDRAGGVRITATRVDGTGNQVWGSAGVDVSGAGGFVASPKIVGTDDGQVVVAWTRDDSTRVAKLDAGSGLSVWPSDVVFTPPSLSLNLSDLQPSVNGAAIVSMVRSGSFSDPRSLFAQKLSEAGQPLWGVAPVTIFDSGSLQFGNFPGFVPDDAGGGVFAWYSSSPALQCFAQRVDASGSLLFANGGTPVATDPGLVRVAPDVAFDSTTQSTYVAWSELNSSQSLSGVRAQRFDAAGSRLWTDSGLELQALSADSTGTVNMIPTGPGALVAWSSGNFAAERLLASLVPADGSSAGTSLEISTPLTEKGRLASTRLATGQAALVWQDGASSAANVLAQNVTDDGVLGPPLSVDVAELSLAAGGSASFLLQTGTSGAGQLHWLLASASGTSPGLPVDGLVLPLAFDALTLATVQTPGSPPFSGYFGALDSTGQSTASLTLSPGSLSSLAGTTLHHAFAVLDLTLGQVTEVSPAVELNLAP